MEYKWFYRSDKNPMRRYDEQAQWTFFEKDNDDIEIGYQEYLFISNDENIDIETRNNASIYNLRDRNYKIFFAHGIQKDGDKERLIGRFAGDVNENKDLKNELNCQNYKWYLDTSENNISSIWAPFRIDDNEKIDNEYKKYNLSKGPNFYENDRFIIDFSLFLLTNKKDKSIQKVVRKNYCPENIARVDYFNNEIMPQKSKNTLSTISDETIQNIEKDYYLTFKNIFPPKSNNQYIAYQNMKFYWNKQTNSILLHIYSQNSFKDKSSDTILESLEENNYIEICEMIKFFKTDEVQISFKEKIPLRLFSLIFKSRWYSKYNDKNEEFWEQFSKEENKLIENHYKQKFLPHQQEKISYAYNSDKIEIDFKLNKYTKFSDNEFKFENSIKRFNPKYGFPDVISRV